MERPGEGTGCNQSSCERGCKRYHCLIFLTIWTPDWLMFYLYGPEVGLRQDLTLYIQSHLYVELKAYMYESTSALAFSEARWSNFNLNIFSELACWRLASSANMFEPASSESSDVGSLLGVAISKLDAPFRFIGRPLISSTLFLKLSSKPVL